MASADGKVRREHVSHQGAPFLILHAGHGNDDCPGLLWPMRREGELAAFTCSECHDVVRVVPLTEVPAAVEGMRIDKGGGPPLACPHCGERNDFSGYSEMFTFVCRHCGKSVRFSERAKSPRMNVGFRS